MRVQRLPMQCMKLSDSASPSSQLRPNWRHGCQEISLKRKGRSEDASTCPGRPPSLLVPVDSDFVSAAFQESKSAIFHALSLSALAQMFVFCSAWNQPLAKMVSIIRHPRLLGRPT